MIIWIKDPEPFQASVILRFLYYSTGLKDIDLYITGLKNLEPFIRYSRTPVEIIKEKVKFDIPKGKFLIIDPNGKDIEEINTKYDGFLIDFKGETEGVKVRGIGIDLLHYEAIALFSKIFIKEEGIEMEEQEVNKDLIYFARKIIEGIMFFDNFYIISPRLIVYALRHILKKYHIIPDIGNVNIKIDRNELIEEIEIAFYDKNLNLIAKDKAILKDKELIVPVLKRKRIKKYKMYIDFDRRRIYLSKNFWIEKTESKEELLKYFPIY